MSLDPFSQSQGLGYVVAVEGLSGLEADFEEVTDKITTRASMAINATARKFRTRSAKLIREEVAFPARYLTGAGGKLRVRRQATPALLEAAIEGRFDPTSLTTFMPKSRRVHGRKAPAFTVSPGKNSKIKASFVMNLSNRNTGLAIRLKPGETLRNKRRMVGFSKKDPSLYLLYGPSVDQVFQSVARDVAPDAAEYLEQEFLRLTENLI